MVSAVGFGASMFGRRPIPQVAMQYRGSPAAAVTAPRSAAGRTAAAPAGATRDDDARRPHPRIDIPAPVRIRSLCLLAGGVVVTAALVGLVLSIIVVGFFALLN